MIVALAQPWYPLAPPDTPPRGVHALRASSHACGSARVLLGKQRTDERESPLRSGPRTLRQYAVIADGERGAVVDPQGNIAFLCVPRWHDDAVFAALVGGGGQYVLTPADDRHVWGGCYEQDSLIWCSRWVLNDAVVESREALAFPGDPQAAVVLRRVRAVDGDAHVRVVLECRAGFGSHRMTVNRHADGTWEGHTGDLTYRWSGETAAARLSDESIVLDLAIPAGETRDLVLEVGTRLADLPPRADQLWHDTEAAWRRARPAFRDSAAPGDSGHSWAVLRGLTSQGGGMVAAATTSLPERADEGRNYDYRYAWIRDQCYAGQAAAVAGAHDLLDSAVRFVTERVLADGPALRPAYTVDGGAVPDERRLRVPGYPGAPARAGNHVNDQFQLDSLGEVLLLLAAADRADRLDRDARAALEVAVAAIDKRGHEPDAGIWELDNHRWAHSRLICAAGLRAVGDDERADAIVRSVDADCLHPSGRWQRSPEDPRVDASLLIPGIRGAVPIDDPRHLRTVEAVVEELADDGYAYRFQHGKDGPLHGAEGAFLLSGFHLALAHLRQGDMNAAVRWFERNRGALGPPGLFTEEFDVVERQLRGNLPQAFVHALLLETAHELGRAGVASRGFDSTRK